MTVENVGHRLMCVDIVISLKKSGYNVVFLYENDLRTGNYPEVSSALTKIIASFSGSRSLMS